MNKKPTDIRKVILIIYLVACLVDSVGFTLYEKYGGHGYVFAGFQALGWFIPITVAAAAIWERKVVKFKGKTQWYSFIAFAIAMFLIGGMICSL